MKLRRVDEELISRDALVGLLFNVSDIAHTLVRIERLLEEDDDGQADDEG